MQISKIKLKQKEKIIVLNLFIVIVFIVFYFFLLSPNLGKIAEVKANLESQRNSLALLEKNGHDIKLVKQNLSLVENYVNKMSNYFIKNDLEFITQIESLANKHHLESKITMGEPVSAGKFNKIVLTMYLQGNYQDQIKFLTELQGIDYYLNIQNVEIVPISDVNNNMTLSIDSYWDKNIK